MAPCEAWQLRLSPAFLLPNLAPHPDEPLPSGYSLAHFVCPAPVRYQ